MTPSSRFLTCLVSAGLCLIVSGTALAGPNAGGTLILHANPSLVFTSGIQDYCGMSGLDSSSAAVTSVLWDPDEKVVFHVIAAFPPESSPRLKALSFGIDFDSTKFIIAAHGECADFEVPGADWPKPGTGTTESWTTSTQTGLLTECYWFAGYVYSEQEGEDSTSVALIPHPQQGGVFVDDASPAAVDTIAGYGSLGFGMTVPPPAWSNPRYSQPTTGPKIALALLRPFRMFDDSDGCGADLDSLTPEEADTIRAYGIGLFTGCVMPEEALAVRSVNPNAIILDGSTSSFEGVSDPDTPIAWWAEHDTTWSLELKLQHAIAHNRAGNPPSQWIYQSVETSPAHDIEIWLEHAVNWTDACPLGEWGTTNGMTARDWIREVAMPEVLRSQVWRDAFDGMYFDTYPGCMVWDSAWDHIDYNNDGIDDGCPRNTDCQYAYDNPSACPYVHSQGEGFTSFIMSLKDSLPERQDIIMVGQDAGNHIHALRPFYNSWKVENWGRQSLKPDGSLKSWWDNWNGYNNTTGYANSEETSRRYSNDIEDPRYDQWQGWEMCILQVLRFPADSLDAPFNKWARYGLGTAMLGDGWFCLEDWREYHSRFYSIPEMREWKVRLPAITAMYKVLDPDTTAPPSTYLFCRPYERLNGDTVTIVVDTLNCDARMVDGLLGGSGVLSGIGGTTPGAHGGAPGTDPVMMFPNPYHPNASISLRFMPRAGEGDVTVYDVQGRRVRRLYLGPVTPALSLAWDGRGDSGSEVAAGLYYLVANSGAFRKTGRLTLLR
jgi:hypothetical protein